MTNEKLTFVSAKRTSENSVDVSYMLDGQIFTVGWNDDLTHSGVGYYDLQLHTKCSNEDLAMRVDDAIKLGETDSNKDLILYLFVRDTFNAYDCAIL